MVIQIDGTNSKNKGAELMFYAIAQEIARKHPSAVIRYVGSPVPVNYFKINNKIIVPWYNNCKFRNLLRRLHIEAIFDCFIKGYYRNCYFNNMTDIVFDASGLRISDKFGENYYRAKRFGWYLKKIHRNGVFLIFLPQAFGPLENSTSRKMIGSISAYANVVIARDDISYKYLLDECEIANLWKYPDFTNLVDGVIPPDFSCDADYITVIPNTRMITQNIITAEGYYEMLSIVIEQCLGANKDVIILNHADHEDAVICQKLAEKYKLRYLSGYNALEIKGIISKGYLTISSRFHGVANSLNSGVPCLATSWSHKYEKLFEDYAQKDCILSINNIDVVRNKLTEMLDEKMNKKYRTNLLGAISKNKAQTQEMWNIIWDAWEKFDKGLS